MDALVLAREASETPHGQAAHLASTMPHRASAFKCEAERELSNFVHGCDPKLSIDGPELWPWPIHAH
jgi:hypothetical protein